MNLYSCFVKTKGIPQRDFLTSMNYSVFLHLVNIVRVLSLKKENLTVQVG